MKENSFSNTMRKKTDQELKTILDNKNSYTEEAIEAVALELGKRNLLEKEEVEKYKVLVDEKLEKTAIKKPTNQININADESPFEELVQPILYSKKAIQGFSIFFSTLFGAILLMSNLKAMNKPKARMQVLFFAIFYTLFTIVLLNFIPRMFFITLIFNIIGYLILTEYFWNQHLGKELSYKKKGITKPLLISLSILILVILLQFLPMMATI